MSNILLQPLNNVKVTTPDGSEMQLNTKIGDSITIYPKELFNSEVPTEGNEQPNEEL